MTITAFQKEILYFVCFELEDWRKEAPNYTCIGITDLRKKFKKTSSELSKELIALANAGYIGETSEMITVNWKQIPANINDLLDGVTVKDAGQSKNAIKSIKSTKSVKKSPEPGKPYSIYGRHGIDEELEDWKMGDKCEFKLQNGNTVVGEFRKFHKNNHSPKGYVVIRYKDTYYERSIKKIKHPKKSK